MEQAAEGYDDAGLDYEEDERIAWVVDGGVQAFENATLGRGAQGA